MIRRRRRRVLGRGAKNPAFWKRCPRCRAQLPKETLVCPECGREFEGSI